MMDGDTAMAELARLYPAPKVVQTLAGPVEVLPLKVRQLSGFARSIGPVLRRMDALGFLGGIGAVSFDPAGWAGLVVDHLDDIVTAISIATGQPTEWLDELYLDDLTLLMQAVVEVNADFFLQMLPMPSPPAAESPEPGLMSSSSSAGPDSATPAT